MSCKGGCPPPPFYVACKTRDDVIHILASFDFKLYTECQRGAFHTKCTQVEREAIKHIKSAIQVAQHLVMMADGLEDAGHGLPTEHVDQVV